MSSEGAFQAVNKDTDVNKRTITYEGSSEPHIMNQQPAAPEAVKEGMSLPLISAKLDAIMALLRDTSRRDSQLVKPIARALDQSSELKCLLDVHKKQHAELLEAIKNDTEAQKQAKERELLLKNQEALLRLVQQPDKEDASWARSKKECEEWSAKLVKAKEEFDGLKQANDMWTRGLESLRTDYVAMYERKARSGIEETEKEVRGKATELLPFEDIGYEVKVSFGYEPHTLRLLIVAELQSRFRDTQVLAHKYQKLRLNFVSHTFLQHLLHYDAACVFFQVIRLPITATQRRARETKKSVDRWSSSVTETLKENKDPRRRWFHQPVGTAARDYVLDEQILGMLRLRHPECEITGTWPDPEQSATIAPRLDFYLKPSPLTTT